VPAKASFASVFPTASAGQPLPEDFVGLVRRLEAMLKAPIWLLIQNADKDFCCSSICIHALKGFESDRAAIKSGQPAAILVDSPGGNAHFAYSIARLFQRRTRDFTVVVPRYAKSAATLLALGSSRLILGQDAELGPLDVQMPDREREDIGSALDAVQSLERLNAFSLTAIDQLMLLMTERTGKKIDTLLPLVFNYATSFVRPLLEKIDTVDFTKKSRELKVAEEYAVRLMRWTYPARIAKQVAAHLVEKYPTHGFVIDCEEAESAATSGETYGLGLKVTKAPPEMQSVFEGMQTYLDTLSAIGRIVEVET
jgi:Serine dehydrogenase proteinase